MACWAFALTLLVYCSGIHARFVAPENKPLKDAMSLLRTDKKLFQKYAHSFKLSTAVRNKFPVTQDEFDCNTMCKPVIELLNAEVESGGNWTNVLEYGVEVCVLALEVAGYQKANEMCPTIIANQLKHIFFILRQKRMNSTHVCEKLNFCDPVEDREPSVIHAATRGHHPRLLKSGRPYKNRPYMTHRKTLRIVQLNDIHYDEEYTEGAPTDCGYLICCRDRFPGEGLAGPFGEHHCNTPKRTLYYFLDEIRNTLKPDLIVFAGDNVPHAPWEETQKTQLAATQHVMEILQERLLNISVYPAIGNHEPFPTNLYYAPRPEVQELNQLLSTLWPKVAPLGPEQVATIRKAAYYSILVQPRLRILSYNSNYGYTNDFYILLNEESEHCGDMKNFMRDTLADAKLNNEKVILLGHHPLGMSDSEITFGRFLKELVMDYHDVIVLTLHGHTHRNHFSVYRNTSGQPVAVDFTAPSLTPWPYYNPGTRLYLLDADTFEVLDYEQYYLHVDEGIEARFRLSHRAKEEYGLEDMSAASWLDLIQRMETDEVLYKKFLINHHNHSSRESQCEDEDCKREMLCHLRNTVYQDTKRCIRDPPASPYTSYARSYTQTTSGMTLTYIVAYMLVT